MDVDEGSGGELFFAPPTYLSVPVAGGKHDLKEYDQHEFDYDYDYEQDDIIINNDSSISRTKRKRIALRPAAMRQPSPTGRIYPPNAGKKARGTRIGGKSSKSRPSSTFSLQRQPRGKTSTGRSNDESMDTHTSHQNYNNNDKKKRGSSGDSSSSRRRIGIDADNDSIIMTVDLKSISLLQAPPIFDEDGGGKDKSSMVLNEKTDFASSVTDAADVKIAQSTAELATGDTQPSSSSSSHSHGSTAGLSAAVTSIGHTEVSMYGTVVQVEDIVEFDQNALEENDADGAVAGDDDSSRNFQASRSIPVPQEESQEFDASIVVEGGTDVGQSQQVMLERVAHIMEETVKLRYSLEDLYDNHASELRQLILDQSRDRKDVLGLAMALRGARLQHASKQPAHVRQQLALETLQLWAPLSFQTGLAAYTPELEVHSYVHLFPRSFSSFISWYSVFRPIARKLIRTFRRDLEVQLKQDPVIPLLFSNLCIQSRLKTPPSAFKKMFKGVKVKSQLYDILGIRIIATMRNVPPPPPPPPPADVGAASGGGDTTSNIVEDDTMTAKNDASYKQTYNIILSEKRDEHERNVSNRAVGEQHQEQQRGGKGDDDNDNDCNVIQGRVQGQGVRTAAAGEDENDENEESEEAEEEVLQLLEEEPYIADESSGYSASFAHEASGLYRLQDIICHQLPGWENKENRYKDYVSHPKPSGYQSLHLSLQHGDSGINMEIQLRSARMHWVAEYGSASHSNYKALLLPQSTSTANTNNSTAGSTGSTGSTTAADKTNPPRATTTTSTRRKKANIEDQSYIYDEQICRDIENTSGDNI